MYCSYGYWRAEKAESAPEFLIGQIDYAHSVTCVECKQYLFEELFSYATIVFGTCQRGRN